MSYPLRDAFINAEKVILATKIYVAMYEDGRMTIGCHYNDIFTVDALDALDAGQLVDFKSGEVFALSDTEIDQIKSWISSDMPSTFHNLIHNNGTHK
jgi:hypothetical protein